MTARTIPGPIYGVTIDNASGAGKAKTARYVDAISKLPHMPTVRLVFDPGQAPSQYAPTITALRDVAYIVGLLTDSSELKKQTVAQVQDQARRFVAAFGDEIDVYEIGNEIGGNWTGSYASTIAKVEASYDVVAGAGLPTMLTLWYNDGCGNGPAELNPLAFTDTWVPPAIKADVDFVMVSYYETLCNDRRPSPSTLHAFFAELDARYPNARLGFGEIGLPNRVTSATIAKAESIANYYYRLGNLGLASYVGGYFWWYFAEDCIPTSDPMWTTIAAAMI